MSAKKSKAQTTTAESITTKKANEKLTALQRLERLEQNLLAQSQHLKMLLDEINYNRQLIGALAKRVNATIKAAEAGKVTAEAVNKIILDANVKELEEKVDFLKREGAILDAKPDEKITKKSFIVGRELDKDGQETNPRIQFSVGSIDEEVQKLVLGKKVGDVVVVDEKSGAKMEITEHYKIVDVVAEKTFEDKE